ncbi:hypothetical protein KCP71_03530 [Salmonella enterica subsp. enterica]|nr:hypothetical protein KCP71_03530 [Salmonella enterica subsp. enterica]
MKVDQFLTHQTLTIGKQLRGWRVQSELSGAISSSSPYCRRNQRDRQQICGWRA